MHRFYVYSFSKLSDKIYKSARTLDFFTSNSWVFPNDNSVRLQNEMNDIDRKVNSYFQIQYKKNSLLIRYLVLISKNLIGFIIGVIIV